jgi:predicted acyltransferase
MANASTRLLSLDAFRGLTMAAMVLANNPGSWSHAYPPLEHAAWNGWTMTDLIFPFFLFIVGVATPFSQASRLSRGDSRGTLAGSVISRAVSLVLLGLLLQGVPSRLPADLPDGFGWLRFLQVAVYVIVPLGFLLLLWPWKSPRMSAVVVLSVAVLYVAAFLLTLRAVTDAAASMPKYDFGNGLLDPRTARFPGVLQRIGVCYLFAALASLLLPRLGIALLAIVLCAGYATLMNYVAFDGSLAGSWARDTNLAHTMDVWVFGPHAYRSYADPEGLLSTMPAIATALLGLLAGHLLRSETPPAERCAKLMVWGVVLACVGVVLDWVAVPINKQIWTPSFVALTAGLACLTLGAMYYVIDVRGRRAIAILFAAFGMNAILVFLLSGIVGRMMGLFRVPATWVPPGGHVVDGPRDYPLRIVLTDWTTHIYQSIFPPAAHTPEALSLAYAVAFLGIFWLFCGVLYAAKVTVRV